MKSKGYLKYFILGVLAVFAIFLVVTYNRLVAKDEKVKLQWSEVQNAYQRRLDLVPNLVSVVKGGAEFEQTTLQKIAEARSKAASLNVSEVSAAGYDAQSKAQDELAAAANRLLISVEKYPDLQGTKAFSTLQTQLERTELRIKFARKGFNESVQAYNTAVRNFPASLVAGMFGFHAKEGFAADAGADKATEIKF